MYASLNHVSGIGIWVQIQHLDKFCWNIKVRFCRLFYFFKPHVHRSFQKLYERSQGRALGLVCRAYGIYLVQGHPDEDERAYRMLRIAKEHLKDNELDEEYWK